MTQGIDLGGYMPIMLNEGMPLLEEGARITFFTQPADAAPDDIPDGYVFRADQGRSDQCTWEIDNTAEAIVEIPPLNIHREGGAEVHKNAFFLGRPLAVRPLMFRAPGEVDFAEVEDTTPMRIGRPGHIIVQAQVTLEGQGVNYYLIGNAPPETEPYTFQLDF